MSDKPIPASGDFFAIRDIGLLRIEGPDASAFAQAQFMNDVAALEPGQWHWNGWLTSKGRVIALFALLRLDAQSFLLLALAGAPPAELASRLRRYVFRSKLVIVECEDLEVEGVFAPPALARGNRADGTLDTGIELDIGTAEVARTLRIGTGTPAPEDAPALARWRAFDLAHGLPRLAQEQVEQWTPQQLSLERLRAFSVKKGCYPGQEIVARTHFLGQAKRGLVRFVGTGLPASGEVASVPCDDGTPPRALGSLACSEGGEALAVMPLDAGDGPFAVGGHPATRQPLLDGLAR